MLIGKGSRQKKKKCVKATAYPCKFACIRREKKCRNPLKHSQAKDFVLWLAKQEERLAKVNAHRAKKGRSQFALTESKLGIVDRRKVELKTDVEVVQHGNIASQGRNAAQAIKMSRLAKDRADHGRLIVAVAKKIIESNDYLEKSISVAVRNREMQSGKVRDALSAYINAVRDFNDGKSDEMNVHTAKNNLEQAELNAAMSKIRLERLEKIHKSSSDFWKSSLYSKGANPKAYEKELLSFLLQEMEGAYAIAEKMIKGEPPVNKKRTNAIKKELLSIMGKENMEKFKTSAKRILNSNDTKLFISLNDSVVPSVIAEGVKNTFEAMTKKGSYQSRRYEIEESVMGIPQGNPPPPYARPIYGYVGSLAELMDRKGLDLWVENYGDAKIELKDSVKNRATITRGDSFSDNTASVPYGEPDATAFYPFYNFNDGDATPKSVRDLRRDENYIEAQVYGGIVASDISAIHYHRNKPSPKTLEAARDNGIKIYFKGERLDV